MADSTPRVVILGSAGEAQQQLLNALNELGAQTLAVGDFDQLDPVQMREQQPDVWLVSIDEGTDSGRLERWQPLFDDPDATVIFDDADVTRRLSGWDLARWARHLAAKVLGRDDVLPPVSPDAERLPQPTASDEAASVSDGRDTPKQPVGTLEMSLMDDAEFAALSASFDSERTHRETTEAAPALGLDDLLRTQTQSVAGGSGSAGNSGAAKPADSSAEATPATSLGLAGLSLLDMDVDLSAPRAAKPAAPDVAIDVSHLELQPLDEGGDAEGSASSQAASAAHEPVNQNSSAPAYPPPPVSPDYSLVEEEETPQETGSEAPAAVVGMITIIAGLGGPDAVRQFLGGLPANLPVPVLLWQHLDAGKHDRLAQQMAKAAKLPVYLAVPGELVRAGEIGVMGSGMGVVSDDGWRIKQGSPSPSNALAPALKDSRTVLVVLSGADPFIAEFARAHKANGGTVLVQTSATCFDGAASAALEGQGIASGSPGNLATRAAEKFAS